MVTFRRSWSCVFWTWSAQDLGLELLVQRLFRRVLGAHRPDLLDLLLIGLLGDTPCHQCHRQQYDRLSHHHLLSIGFLPFHRFITTSGGHHTLPPLHHQVCTDSQVGREHQGRLFPRCLVYRPSDIKGV